MEHLFFNIDGGVENAAEEVFKALGMGRSIEGDSANNPSGIYFEHSAFGVVLKVEENVYDYEDEFQYMLSIKKDMLTDLEVPNDDTSHLASIASTSPSGSRSPAFTAPLQAILFIAGSRKSSELPPPLTASS